MKRIAVVGAGISGLAAAYFLSRRHEVHLFEREARLGGHTHTVLEDSSNGPVALDTGFLVHNERTYPGLVRLFRETAVATRGSDMSFSVACPRTGFEYSSRGPLGFCATPSSLLCASHAALFRDILRFNRTAPRLLAEPEASTVCGTEDVTLGEFLDRHRFGARFREWYLLPMASAIWSAPPGTILECPATTLVRFLHNHGLLAVTGQPVWRTVQGGSAVYIPKLTAPLAGRVHLRAAIERVTRSEDGVTVTFRDRAAARFDEIVFACHGDQVLPLLGDPSPVERDVFSRFRTTSNTAWLHTDVSILPRRRAARASWNYRLAGGIGAARGEGAGPAVTYHLNRLQGLTCREQFCVTLNPETAADAGAIDGSRVLRRFVYRHPLYTRDAVRAQDRWREVSGTCRTHFCGAYWYYGFHEDGLRSAVRVSQALGVEW